MQTTNLKTSSVALEEKLSRAEFSESSFSNIGVAASDMGAATSYTMIESIEIEEMIDRKVEEKIRKIFQERNVTKFREITDSRAKQEITNFILESKKRGIVSMNILDIIINLSLPPEQIEKIMKRFETEKKVSVIL